MASLERAESALSDDVARVTARAVTAEIVCKGEGRPSSPVGVGVECFGVCFGVGSGEFEWEGRVFEWV